MSSIVSPPLTSMANGAYSTTPHTKRRLSHMAHSLNGSTSSYLPSKHSRTLSTTHLTSTQTVASPPQSDVLSRTESGGPKSPTVPKGMTGESGQSYSNASNTSSAIDSGPSEGGLHQRNNSVDHPQHKITSPFGHRGFMGMGEPFGGFRNQVSTPPPEYFHVSRAYPSDGGQKSGLISSIPSLLSGRPLIPRLRKAEVLDGDDTNELSTAHYDNSASSSPYTLNSLLIDLKSRLPSSFVPTQTLKFVVLCVAWYLSSAITNNIGKSIFNVYRYPVTLTWVQFGFVAMYCVLVGQGGGFTTIRLPTWSILKTTLPLSAFGIVGHVFSSLAISRVPVSFVHTIKALSPLFTVLFYRFIFQVHYSHTVYVSLLPLTLGVMLACSFAISSNVMGLLCALGSCLVFVSQNIFSKRVLFTDKGTALKSTKLDKINLLFYSSSCAFILMFPMWFITDGLVITAPSSHVVFQFILNGTCHFCQNLFAFTLLSMTSPVTYSIASLVKRIFVIVVAIVWFGQQVGLVQWVGIILTFWGLWLYQGAKHDVEVNEQGARRDDSLPTKAS